MPVASYFPSQISSGTDGPRGKSSRSARRDRMRLRGRACPCIVSRDVRGPHQRRLPSALDTKHRMRTAIERDARIAPPSVVPRAWSRGWLLSDPLCVSRAMSHSPFVTAGIRAGLSHRAVSLAAAKDATLGWRLGRAGRLEPRSRLSAGFGKTGALLVERFACDNIIEVAPHRWSPPPAVWFRVPRWWRVFFKVGACSLPIAPHARVDG